MPNDEHLLPTVEVAEILGQDVRSVHRKVARGELSPVAKAPGLRGAYLFKRSDVEALLNPSRT